MPAAYAELPPAPLFFSKEVALLPGCLYDIKDRLPLAFEVKGTAAIPETGIMGDVIMDAVAATSVFIG